MGLWHTLKMDLYNNRQRPAQWLDWEDAAKHFSKPNLTPEEGHGHWWPATSLIHYSFLNALETITSEKCAQQIDEMHRNLQGLQLALVNRKSQVLLQDSAWLCVAQPVLQKLNRLGHKVPPHPPCSSEWVSESHSVVSNSLGPHGLFSPWNASGLSTGVGSLFLLQRIFPTQESNWVSCIVGGFFTSWATGKRHIHLTSRLTDPASQKLSAGKMLPQPAGCRTCFARVWWILKHGFLCTGINKLFPVGGNVLIVMVSILINKDAFEPSYTPWKESYDQPRQHIL